MSALGQERTSAHVRVMSALPPKADIRGGLILYGSAALLCEAATAIYSKE
jgi:hypothetical protein